MKTYRSQIFETNSSSSHSLVIGAKADYETVSSPTGVIVIGGSHINPNAEILYTAIDKACYYAQAAFSMSSRVCMVEGFKEAIYYKEDELSEKFFRTMNKSGLSIIPKLRKLKNVIEKQTGCKVIFDYQSLMSGSIDGDYGDIFYIVDKNLKDFIFNPQYFIEIEQDR